MERIEVYRSKKAHQKYGKITKIVFQNGGKIFITKKGWNLVTPKGKEMNLPFSEINAALQETIIAGYVVR